MTNKVAVLALDLQEVVGTAYTEEGAQSPSVGVTLVPGQITTDDWCWGGCGTAYVRLDALYGSSVFPNPDTTPVQVPSPLVARFHVGMHRCVSGMGNNGEPPSVVAQTEDALALLDDAWTLMCALRPYMKERGGKGGSLLGTWTPVGPQGDCAGGFWPVTIRV